VTYENDVFISYAHEDNQPVPPEKDGWVDQFELALRAYLGKEAGDPPRIWRDPTLERTGDLNDKIREHLVRSAVLLCVLSKSYVRSHYCLDELRDFLKEFGDNERVVKVVTASLPDEHAHPPPLDKAIGYPFYELDEQTKRAYELDPDSEQSRRVYRRLIYDVAREIAARLGGIKGAPLGVEKGIVYLARTSYDLNEQREALRSELDRNGFRILPDGTLPATDTECETAIQNWLGQSCLSVHLFGKFRGGIPDGPRAESYVELQNRLAVAHSSAVTSGFGRLLWMPPGLVAGDEAQAAFLVRVHDDPATYTRTDLFQGSFEDFKAAVLKKAEEASAPEAPPKQEAATVPRVYLIYDPADENAIAPIDDFLSQKKIEVRLPVFEGPEDARHRDHVDALVQSAAVMLYWGTAGELWLNRQLGEIQKSQGYGRTTPPSIAVCIADPMNPRKERWLRQTRMEQVLPMPGGVNQQALGAFADSLRR